MKKTLIMLCAAAMLLTACHKTDEAEPENGTAARTVLIYVAGDNNLSGKEGGLNFFRYDMKQIMEGTRDLSTVNKVVLFVDCYDSRPYFLQVEKGDTLRLRTMDREMKSSDPETLHEAMSYAVEHFPAESYGLVLWGHADGWITRSANGGPRRAYGKDDTGGVTWMEIPDMARTLASLPKLKFIFADCCAFLCVENAYELRQCADYIIGSPAEIPGEGAPYQNVVPAMFGAGDDFYKSVIDFYAAQASDGYKVPLAAVKCSEMDNLAQATATTLATIAGDIAPDDDGCRYPDVKGLIFYYDHTQFDMQDFMLRYASDDQYAEWKRAFDKAVPYHTYASVWMANHVMYSSKYVFSDFNPEERRMGTMGMFVPQRESDAVWWDSRYVVNLGVINTSVGKLNSSIKNMQWYGAAHLSDLGW